MLTSKTPTYNSTQPITYYPLRAFITHNLLPITLFISIFLAISPTLLDYATHYLTYSDQPEKTDAVVLFVGPDFKARQEEIKLLFTEGYAGYLLIPAYGKIQEASSPSHQAGTQTADSHLNIPVIKHKKYFENTHNEVLEAKRMMEQYGLKSAIFVSSPYHMRRIKIITEKIFDDKSTRIDFIPTRFETVHHNLLHLTLSDWSNLATEYIKIIWFLIYNPFPMTHNP